MKQGLILDRRASVLAMQVCRALGRQQYDVDIFGESGSPAFHSRFCRRRIVSPPCNDGARVSQTVARLLEGGTYDAIYVCNEEILERIVPLAESGALRALPVSDACFLKLMLSKNRMIELVGRAGVPVPRTLVPSADEQAVSFAAEVGMPVVIKGDRGESGRNVVIVDRISEVSSAYRRVRASEADYDGRPALQEFIRGTAYSIGGLFDRGRPLRVCAHRKLLTYPPRGGWTVKGVTERPPGLLEEAFKVFAATQYTGLGHVEFMRDARSGDFKFLEINPRVWGSIGIASHAGVDLFSAYEMLASGVAVAPDLRYQEGVRYHRFSGEARFILQRPGRLLGFLVDSLNPDVHSDFEWADLGPHFARAIRFRNPSSEPPVCVPGQASGEGGL